MFKLIKYEVRKSRAALGILLAAIIALEAYYLISLSADSYGNTVTAAVLLAVSGFAAAIAVFAVGIASYSNELKQKTSYLIFLTPNSSLAIMAAKTLFTLFAALVFGGLLGGLCVLDLKLLLERYNEMTSFYEMIDSFLQSQNINLSQFYLLVGFTAANVLVQVIGYLVVAYFAVTFSATVMQQKKGRGFVTVLVYLLILFGLNRLSSLWVRGVDAFENVRQLVRALVPELIQNAVVILLSLFGSAWLLDKKVSL